MSYTVKMRFEWVDDPFTGQPFSAYEEFNQGLYDFYMAGKIDVDFSSVENNGLKTTRLAKDMESAQEWIDFVVALRTKYNGSHPTYSIELI
jgi:hypothetical protein